MTDDEYEEAKAEIEDVFDEVREALAADLGGEPEDYRFDSVAPSGGGDE